MSQNDLPALITVTELAAFLQIPIKTLYAWRSQGIGPKGIKVGRFVRYAERDVAKWLATL
jgi:predicted DNA-binding transcriptional regulator AlpA